MRTPYETLGKGRNLRLPALLAVAVLVLVGPVAQLWRPVPPLSAVPAAPPHAAVQAAGLPWPATGAAAVGMAETGLMATANDGASLPLASVTKVMTALVVLDGHPLRSGEPGPSVTITHADVVEYLREAGEDQSVVSVAEGELLTELQLLEALLIPSGNNIADLLARWDAGSMEAFVAKMNAKAAALGMTKTRYTDASGISPGSVGSAADQVRLGIAAMQYPVFAQIVGMTTAELPVAGKVRTTNRLLGTHEIVGIKTGNTDEAGGCLMFASTSTIEGQKRLVVGAVLGQKSLDDAFEESARLADAMSSAVRSQVVVSAGANAGALSSTWGGRSELRPARDVSMLTWQGAKVETRTELREMRAPVPAGTEVGTMTVQAGTQRVTVPVRTVSAIGKPGLLWRLLRR